jgi:heme oxygenase (biliverdin-IX-beta and delta-forming)
LFFGGRGDEVGAVWQRFRGALDAFGNQQPLLQADVVTGAECVFGAILGWFTPFRSVAGVHR